MSFDVSRVNVSYRDGVTATKPIIGRVYTMTHSDETAELFVTIGREIANDMISPMRDEVLLWYDSRDHELQLVGSVIVNAGEEYGKEEFRNEIFLREMPVALTAIRTADQALFERYPVLDDIPIYIQFQSEQEQYNKIYDFGTMKEYQA